MSLSHSSPSPSRSPSSRDEQQQTQQPAPAMHTAAPSASRIDGQAGHGDPTAASALRDSHPQPERRMASRSAGSSSNSSNSSSGSSHSHSHSHSESVSSVSIGAMVPQSSPAPSSLAGLFSPLLEPLREAEPPPAFAPAATPSTAGGAAGSPSPSPSSSGSASAAAAAAADSVAGFRPPSPANVVHLLAMSPIATPEVVALQTLLDAQGEALFPLGTSADESSGSAAGSNGGVKADSPREFTSCPGAAPRKALHGPLLVPQLFHFFHFHQQPPPRHKHSRKSSRGSGNGAATPTASSGANSASHSPRGTAPSASGERSRRGSSGSLFSGFAVGSNSGSTVSGSSSGSGSSQHHAMQSPQHSTSGSDLLTPTDSASGALPSPRPYSLDVARTSQSPPIGAPTPVATVAGSTPSPMPPRHSRRMSVSDLQLSMGEHRLLLRDVLNEYASISFENPRAFAAFYKHRTEEMTLHERATMVYRHLKGRESGPAAPASLDKQVRTFMQAHKKEIVHLFEQLLAERSLRIARLAPQLINAASPCVAIIQSQIRSREEYLQSLNDVVSKLRERFLQARRLVDQRLAALLQQLHDQPSAIPTYEEMNLRILSACFEPELQRHIHDYHLAYRRAAAGFPGRLLLSSLFRNRIESRSAFDSISFNDLVIGVEESTAHLRKVIHNFFRIHPDVAVDTIKTHAAAASTASSAEPHADAALPEEEEIAQMKLTHIYKLAFLGFIRASRIYPKLLSPSTFGLVRKLDLRDVMAFRLLCDNRFMEALWRLHDIHEEGQAEALETWMNKALFTDQQVVSCAPLGGGFTTTKLMTMQADDSELPGVTSHSGLVHGVYKPKPKPSLFNLQSLKDNLVSNHRKEVAAYRIDKLLQLNHVPLTKSMLWEEREGSLQIFVASAVSARALQELNLAHPTAPGKFSAAKGRSQLPRRIRLFDFLIDNRDRNLDNYLISTIDQRVVLIDHGWTFTTPTVANELSHYHNRGFLLSLIPHRQLFERCRWLSEQPSVIDKELQFLLSQDNLAAFKRRLNLFVKFVTNEVQQHGDAHVFAEAEKTDRRCLCDGPHEEISGLSSDSRSATATAEEAEARAEVEAEAEAEADLDSSVPRDSGSAADPARQPSPSIGAPAPFALSESASALTAAAVVSSALASASPSDSPSASPVSPVVVGQVQPLAAAAAAANSGAAHPAGQDDSSRDASVAVR